METAQKKEQPAGNTGEESPKWSLGDETLEVQHVCQIRVRKEQAGRQTLTSAHKSEQVASAWSQTLKWIHLRGRRRRWARPICPLTLSCTVHNSPSLSLVHYLHRSRQGSVWLQVSDRQTPPLNSAVCSSAPGSVRRSVLLPVRCFLEGSWPDEARLPTLITSWPRANASCRAMDLLRGAWLSGQACRHQRSPDLTSASSQGARYHHLTAHLRCQPSEIRHPPS